MDSTRPSVLPTALRAPSPLEAEHFALAARVLPRGAALAFSPSAPLAPVAAAPAPALGAATGALASGVVASVAGAPESAPAPAAASADGAAPPAPSSPSAAAAAAAAAGAPPRSLLSVFAWSRDSSLRFLAGGCAGAAAKTLIAPLDRVKILFQISDRPFSFRGVAQELLSTARREGLPALFRGNSAQIMRV
jgi:solute carrier family 25, member 42